MMVSFRTQWTAVTVCIAALGFAQLTAAQSSAPPPPMSGAAASSDAPSSGDAAGARAGRGEGRGGGGAGGGGNRLQEADTNKDGILSKDEWTAAGLPDPIFGMFDADSDGKVTQDEMKAGREKIRQRRAGGE